MWSESSALPSTWCPVSLINGSCSLHQDYQSPFVPTAFLMSHILKLASLGTPGSGMGAGLFLFFK